MTAKHLRRICLGFFLAAACGGQGEKSPAVDRPVSNQQIATFQGEFDPATGTLTFRTMPADGLAAAVVLPEPVFDGKPGTGPDDTFEMVTEASPAPGVVTDGCGTGVPAFEGSITVRSFYKTIAFSNIWVQITSLSPSGFEACNSATPPAGYDGTLGLWAYGPLGTKSSGLNAKTVSWHFKFPSSQRFTFVGRILGDYSTTTPEFDWTPASIGWAKSTFVEQGTTLAHIVWNGSTFVDTFGRINFIPHGGSATNNSVGLWSPPLPYASGFTNDTGTPGTWYIADAAHGGNAIDTSHTFTACMKFKPGAHPGDSNPNKVYFGKGQAETPVGGGTSYEGWALMQMHNRYCFHYKTIADAPDTMAQVDPSVATPQSLTYDYSCGGRTWDPVNGSTVDLAAHGRDLAYAPQPIAGTTFANPAALPMVIGAYPDGTHAALDGGIYEAIIDSRPPTAAVMREIVARAEGWALPGSVNGSAIYLSPSVPLLSAPGYTLPPYAGTPLDPTKYWVPITYTNPLYEDTSATGFCVGAQVTAGGAWSGVSGTPVSFSAGGTSFSLALNPFRLTSSPAYASANDNWSTETGWANGSTHTFKACVQPYGAGTPQATLYLDGVAAGGGTNPAAVTSAITNLGDSTGTLTIGRYLTNANLVRLFMCPTPDPAGCN